ncbi:hypothetical protein EXIGLDRAFT_736262 [Exidia glandulosa HHB12029]|uniref:C2H2-type domain-containing protein n=1 Tax=Exidia glandulosa HHB12029 TaxID=1314781 RepID=A0A165JHA7_EXIGL|nr:hypothetical protein EXIGLDRAFT_736262 [Exidia glandulosa HHB12029]
MNVNCEWAGCRARCTTPKELYEHLYDVHTVSANITDHVLVCRWNGCTVRPRVGSGTSALARQHLCSHAKYYKPYACERCGAAFPRVGKLEEHKMRSCVALGEREHTTAHIARSSRSLSPLSEPSSPEPDSEDGVTGLPSQLMHLQGSQLNEKELALSLGKLVSSLQSGDSVSMSEEDSLFFQIQSAIDSNLDLRFGPERL